MIGQAEIVVGTEVEQLTMAAFHVRRLRRVEQAFLLVEPGCLDFVERLA